MASRGVVLRWGAFCVAVLLFTLVAFHALNGVLPVQKCNGDRNALIGRSEDVEARKDRIKYVCQRHRSWQGLQRPTTALGIHKPSMTTEETDCSPKVCPLFVDQSRTLAFCSIAKVASTSIKHLFSPLLNVTVTGNRSGDALHWSFNSQTLRFGARALLQSPYSNYNKVLFVRHPFERLVSTYIDKVLQGRTKVEWAYRKYWDTIPGVKAEDRSPTFSEFVDFLLTSRVESWDVHWYPYYSRCQPCLLDYHFVGKLETASRDFPMFLSLVGINDKEASLGHYNVRSNVREASAMDSKHYFAQLSFDQVMGLYVRYFYDFELFGYDFRDYLP